MTTRQLALAATMVLVGGVPLGFAQSGSGNQYVLERPPAPSVGDVLTYRVGAYRQAVYTFIGPQGDLLCYSLVFAGLPSTACKTTDDNFVTGIPTGRTRLSFPLYVGKAWEYTRQPKTFYENTTERTSFYGALRHDEFNIFTTNARVTAYEPVTVAAGTFYAFKIEATAIQWGESGINFLATTYYSPQLGMIKRTGNPAGPESYTYNTDIELVSYTRGANGAR
jgi:hypothetical protein